MGLSDMIEPVPRKTMVLFFVIDTSGSMEGTKIGIVNSTIEELIPDLKDLSGSNSDAEIKIAVLQFSTGATWLTPSGPVDLENFTWKYLEAFGVTDLGEACEELNKKLSTKAFMSEATGSYAPAIFLMSDGMPTDDYKKELTRLKDNNWFKKAIKVAIAIGDNADRNILEEFTGSNESVLVAENSVMLKKMVRFVSVRASEVASKSSSAGNDGGFPSKQKEFEQDIKDFKDELEFDDSSAGSFDDSFDSSFDGSFDNPSDGSEVW